MFIGNLVSVNTSVEAKGLKPVPSGLKNKYYGTRTECNLKATINRHSSKSFKVPPLLASILRISVKIDVLSKRNDIVFRIRKMK